MGRMSWQLSLSSMEVLFLPYVRHPRLIYLPLITRACIGRGGFVYSIVPSFPADQAEYLTRHWRFGGTLLLSSAALHRMRTPGRPD
jgi:hypothetical protein